MKVEVFVFAVLLVLCAGSPTDQLRKLGDFARSAIDETKNRIATQLPSLERFGNGMKVAIDNAVHTVDSWRRCPPSKLCIEPSMNQPYPDGPQCFLFQYIHGGKDSFIKKFYTPCEYAVNDCLLELKNGNYWYNKVLCGKR